jgi:hypothetical protein
MFDTKLWRTSFNNVPTLDAQLSVGRRAFF